MRYDLKPLAGAGLVADQVEAGHQELAMTLTSVAHRANQRHPTLDPSLAGREIAPCMRAAP